MMRINNQKLKCTKNRKPLATKFLHSLDDYNEIKNIVRGESMKFEGKTLKKLLKSDELVNSSDLQRPQAEKVFAKLTSQHKAQKEELSDLEKHLEKYLEENNSEDKISKLNNSKLGNTRNIKKNRH